MLTLPNGKQKPHSFLTEGIVTGYHATAVACLPTILSNGINASTSMCGVSAIKAFGIPLPGIQLASTPAYAERQFLTSYANLKTDAIVPAGGHDILSGCAPSIAILTIITTEENILWKFRPDVANKDNHNLLVQHCEQSDDPEADITYFIQLVSIRSFPEGCSSESYQGITPVFRVIEHEHFVDAIGPYVSPVSFQTVHLL